MECQLCGAPARIPCPHCGALFYCSEKHRHRHLRVAHKDECARMSEQVSSGQRLMIELPFTWAAVFKVGADGSEGGGGMCGLLASAGVHGTGLWQRECGCWEEDSGAPWGSLGGRPGPAPPSAALPASWGAPLGDGCAGGWGTYLSARGLGADSVEPLVLSSPLTLAAALRRLRPWPAGPAVVHWLGPQKELDQAPALLEAAAAAPPGSSLHVRLIGPDVPPAWDGLGWDLPRPGGGRLAATCHAGPYHSWLRAGGAAERPCAVFAPNAGIAAYASWIDTLEALTREGSPPCLVTDYTEEAARRAAAAVEAVAAAAASPASRLEASVEPNPFRCPTRNASGTALPAFSNGWLVQWNFPP